MFHDPYFKCFLGRMVPAVSSGIKLGAVVGFGERTKPIKFICYYENTVLSSICSRLNLGLFNKIFIMRYF